MSSHTPSRHIGHSTMGLTPSKLSDADFPSQAGKVVVVTGANAGLGLATAKEFARKGARVVMACRSEERARNALKQVQDYAPGSQAEFLPLDLSDLDSVTQFARDLETKCGHVDVLINNAGVMTPPYSKTKQGFEMQIGVNHFGHYALTLRLLPLLRKAPSGNARVVTLSSMAAVIPGAAIHFEDINFEKSYSGWSAYQQSKLANQLFSLELGKRLAATKGEGDAEVSVFTAHPGATHTELQRHNGFMGFLSLFVAMSPMQGALSQIYAGGSPNAKPGTFYGPAWISFGAQSPQKMGKPTLSDDDAAKLWKVSAEKTGLDLA
eukprot:TRINITY_DN800_c0_g2_i1.p1 TRINITY_DN800_c0_g2~~TRINITY_DN800_c0_g2_i1.p1  ORF type:complete len:322 (+),score=117.45 TRINITY_DN800_c0_g2_i1:207-1172(+)